MVKVFALAAALCVEQSQATNCRAWCQSEGKLCAGGCDGGYVVGSSPFCGGNPGDCNPTSASSHGFTGGVSVKKVKVEGGVTINKEYKISYDSYPGTQKKKFEDGGSKCWTGTKMCCCYHKSESPTMSVTLNSTSLEEMDVHV